MKTAGLILMLFAAAAPAQTNPNWRACRQPVRLFGAHQSVNLTPLFDWWKRQPLPGQSATNTDADIVTERPLTAWHRITGTKAGEVGASWVVNAVIFTSPTTRTNERIFLNHPPIAEEEAFYALKAQLAQAGQLIANAQRAYQAATNAAQNAEVQARNYRNSGTKHATESSNNFLRLAGQKREAAAAALNQKQQLEAARPLLQKQFDAIPAANGRYQIDLFALAMGRNSHDVAIYDVGVVPPDSP
jgi:hypothetical protein